MTLFLSHAFPSHHLTRSSSLSLVNCSFKSRAPTNAEIPARDRVIDFGKHKGKMLGTLPSTYLKWVSDNLRARDFEGWAKLADQVLQDPVYKDRIEWEFAENLLSGNNNIITSMRNESAVSELLEISERFGWDNRDKVGWSRVSFELLGTSNGGRIPRVSKNGGKDRDLGVNKREKVEDLSKGQERRRERRERVKMKTEGKKESKVGVRDKVYEKSSGGDVRRVHERDDRGNSQDGTMDIYNPFPGREALLKKVLNHKRSL
ncbi:uncharacterized protein LOC132176090 [Corylus avellana]|uniref:uncharacterized protein LOC132176090 n=1 Tax=Corylus avellana TaxID=13451 RepID=UPI001E21D9E3|nr:uncharacterized protein LOC132176090 [Corylus avellana]